MEDTIVEEGDMLVLHASSSECSLSMEVELVEQARTTSVDAAGTTTLSEGSHSAHDVFYVERSDLLRLNDSHYMSCYQSALTQALAAIKQEGGGGGSIGGRGGGISGGGGGSIGGGGGGDDGGRGGDDDVEQGGGGKGGEEEEGSGVEADCLVLDMHQGLSLLGLAAAKLGRCRSHGQCRDRTM